MIRDLSLRHLSYEIHHFAPLAISDRILVKATSLPKLIQINNLCQTENVIKTKVEKNSLQIHTSRGEIVIYRICFRSSSEL